MPNAEEEENVTCELIKTPNLEYYSNIEQFSKNMLELQKVVISTCFSISKLCIKVENFRLENE